jgi:hypothetical protein
VDVPREVGEWVASRIYDTNFFYQSFFGGDNLYETENSDIITSYTVETRDGEFYRLVLDKERDIAITHYPARTVISPPELFYLQNDGLIGIADGKVENEFLDRLREEGFNMKAVLNSRRKAMEKIDYLRQKDI